MCTFLISPILLLLPTAVVVSCLKLNMVISNAHTKMQEYLLNYEFSDLCECGTMKF